VKDFAHPPQAEKIAIDLNRAIESTLIIARNEYRYVATVEKDFGEFVSCHAGAINQVVLNVVVNAAHAIEDVVKGTGQNGKIKIKTCRGVTL
jgi:two-component system, NtrC family, sensor kinase